MSCRRLFCQYAALLVALAFACACASSSPELENTHDLELTLEGGAAAQFAKCACASADPTEWNVRCVSLGDDGVRTTINSVYDPDIVGFEVEHVPDDRDTVCHIVDADGVLLSTISIEDATSLLGRRDIFRLKKDARATISFDAGMRVSSAQSADFLLGDTETRADLEGRWSVNCQDVRDIVTDDLAPDIACPEEVDGSQLYLHMVVAADASGGRRAAYGIWRTEEAFSVCGTTEGLDELPQGWVIEDPVHAAPFVWTSPFSELSPQTASSDDIMRMIRANDKEGMQTYDAFAEANPEICQREDRCTLRYYDQMRTYALKHSGSVCWPKLLFSYDDDDRATASVWLFPGGLARPVGRIDFIEAYQYGNETYMRNLVNHARTAYAGGVPIECQVREEYLVAVEIPDSDEDGRAEEDADDAEIKARLSATDDLITVGTALEARYQARVEVSSSTGKYDNLCRQDLGLEAENGDEGFYADVILESLSDE